jgi:hypothetical protein
VTAGLLGHRMASSGTPKRPGADWSGSELYADQAGAPALQERERGVRSTSW